MPSDIEIAQNTKLKPITEIADSLEIPENNLIQYGKYKAKVDFDFIRSVADKPNGKLILVTATTPTPAGEGKTTTAIGLGLSLNKIGKKQIVCLREPSLGPVFGIKGGAAGGGYAQVLPMEDINLHFTGDLHAITTAHNLLSALLDNHLKQGNALKIDSTRIVWKRVMDMNDRSLRQIVIGLGGSANGVPREDGFDITVASEVMAIFCLSKDLVDCKERLGRIIVAYTTDGNPVTAHDLRAEGAMAALLKDALLPNLVQTTENTPAFVHGGPFANIAHGTNSIIATKLALKLADYVVTEAGFAADLGAEKFLDIVSRIADYTVSAVVIVTTIRSLKMHGNDSLERGIPNMLQHIENMKKYGLPVVVAINRFTSDTEEEIALVKSACERVEVKGIMNDIWAKGGDGGTELAAEVVRLSDGESAAHPIYPLNMPLKEKVETIAHEIYRADGVVFTPSALKDLETFEKLGFGTYPVCIAKTQYSFSDNAKLLGVAKNFKITIQKVKLSAGAGFVVALSGDIMTMPGLPKEPAAFSIDVNENGIISGLF